MVGSVHEAREAVRAALAVQPSSHVEVQLLPGVHHVGTSGLQLNAEDGAAAGGSVTWKSADASNPASLVSSFSPPQRTECCGASLRPTHAVVAHNYELLLGLHIAVARARRFE